MKQANEHLEPPIEPLPLGRAQTPPIVPCAMGVFVGALIPLPHIWHPVLIFFGAASIISTAYFICRHKELPAPVLQLFVFLVAMVLGLMLQGHELQRQRLPCLVDVSVAVQRVYVNDYGQSVQCAVSEMHNQAPEIKRLSCFFPPVPVLEPGERLHVRGMCEWSDTYARWQLHCSEIVSHEDADLGPRTGMWAAINKLPRHQGIASALLLGAAPQADKLLFREAGIAHVLVVSGMHVGIVFMLCACLLRASAVPWYPAQCVLIAVLLFYMWLTTYAVPTQRAVLMASIVILGNVLGRDVHRYTALSFTVLVLLLYDPLMARSLSFQLSVAAVMGILTMGLSLRDLRLTYLPLRPWALDRPLWCFGLWVLRGAIDALAIGVAASLAVMPFIAWHIGVANPWSPIATVLVTPLLTAVIACGGIYVACATVWASGPWQGLVTLTDWSLDLLYRLTYALSQLPGAVTDVSPPSVVSLWLWPLLFIPFVGLKQLRLRGLLLIMLFCLW